MIAFDIQAGLPLPDTQTVVEKAVSAALSGSHFADAEIGVILTGDEQIRELNKTYRGIDKPT
ncbi:MAG TPA: rRNA maturation RNAse YbeY, partial [Clostridia bacterium]|nr:rRNA maturation RNAse YbeY [Clostridia bacterium]